jgi:hypothetical protein
MKAPQFQSSSTCFIQLYLTPHPPTLFFSRTVTRTFPSDLQQQPQGQPRSNSTKFARLPTIRRLEQYNVSNNTTSRTIQRLEQYNVSNNTTSRTIRHIHHNGTTRHPSLDSPPALNSTSTISANHPIYLNTLPKACSRITRHGMEVRCL